MRQTTRVYLPAPSLLVHDNHHNTLWAWRDHAACSQGVAREKRWSVLCPPLRLHSYPPVPHTLLWPLQPQFLDLCVSGLLGSSILSSGSNHSVAASVLCETKIVLTWTWKKCHMPQANVGKLILEMRIPQSRRCTFASGKCHLPSTSSSHTHS